MRRRNENLDPVSRVVYDFCQQALRKNRLRGVEPVDAQQPEEPFGRTRSLDSHGLTWHVDERDVVPLRFDSDARFLQAAPNRFVAALGGLVIKESGPRPGRGRLLYGLRPSAGPQIVRHARMLLACGIPTHRPVAWAVRRAGLLRVRDYVITREIKDSEVLTHRLDRLRDTPAGRVETLRVWGELVASLHRHGFSNRDLKDANMLCSLAGPLRMWVTDLEGLRRFPFLPAAMAEGDLGPVALSLRSHGWLQNPDDRDSFFSAYNKQIPERLRRHEFPAVRRGDDFTV
jgi:hypothetical protein